MGQDFYVLIAWLAQYVKKKHDFSDSQAGNEAIWPMFYRAVSSKRELCFLDNENEKKEDVEIVTIKFFVCNKKEPQGKK